MSLLPNRGEIWLADLNPTRGHKQAGARPVLIISTNRYCPPTLTMGSGQPSLLLSYLRQEFLRIFPPTVCIMGVTETGPLQVIPHFVYALERGPRSITFLQQLTQHHDELGQLLVWEGCC